MTSRDDRAKLAKRIEKAAIEAGSDPAEARRQAAEFAGVQAPAEPKKAKKSGGGSRAKPKRRRRRAPVKIPAASSLGALFAQALGLVVLYWAVRAAAGVSSVLQSVRGAIEWFVSPAGINQGGTSQ